MIKFARTIFYEIEKNNQENYLLEPIWIFKTEKMFHRGKFYLTLFLYQNEIIKQQLKGLSFNIDFANERVNLVSYDFLKVKSDNDENMLSIIFELPSHYDGSAIKVSLAAYYTNDGIIKTSPTCYHDLRLDLSQKDEKKNSFLEKEIDNYVIFPSVKMDYWQCYCGKINSISENECVNCCADKKEILSFIQMGIEELILSKYLAKNPLIYTSVLPSEENIGRYIEKFEEFSIPKVKIISYLQNNGFLNIYQSVNPIKYDKSSVAEEVVEDYIAPLVRFGFDCSSINNKDVLGGITQNIIMMQKAAAIRSKKIIKSVIALIVSCFIFLITAFIVDYVDLKNDERIIFEQVLNISRYQNNYKDIRVSKAYRCNSRNCYYILIYTDSGSSKQNYSCYNVSLDGIFKLVKERECSNKPTIVDVAKINRSLEESNK